MSFLDKVGEELEEEREQQQTDMHAVDIGIGCYDHIVVAEAVYALLYVQGRLQQIEFFVLVDYFLCQAVGVEGLSA